MSTTTADPIKQSNFGLSTSFYAVLSKLNITNEYWRNHDKLYKPVK